MSENLPKNQQNEEIDLIVLIRLFSRGFARLFNKIEGFLKKIFSGLIYLLKPVVKNIKIPLTWSRDLKTVFLINAC